MARRPYDPLAWIPSPEVVREKLIETETLAQRLRILLNLAERLHLPLTTAAAVPQPAERKGAAGV